ncbi:MAG: sodium:calcium antiporter [Pirellula sp.]|jgi:cation:H+ antiporter|nr:sodium:calcium antiporter [Pirellula sp.]
MTLLLSLLVFLVSVAFLILAAKFFTQAAEVIGYGLGLSPFVVGVVIVSIGTSLPELISAIAAAQSANSEIVAGNVIGSSLSNILFVLGLTAILSPKRIDLGAQYIYVDLNFLAGAAFILTVIMYDGTMHLAESLLGLTAYLVYLYYLLKTGGGTEDNESAEQQQSTVSSTYWKSISILIASGVVIYFAANKTIESLSGIADQLGVSKAIVSMTLLSLGTTLPECVVSVSAALAGKSQIAVGNVLGSCIFNALAIPGVAACFGPLNVPAELIGFSLPAYGGLVLMFYLLTQDKRISSFEGALFLLIYALFIGKVSRLL